MLGQWKETSDIGNGFHKALFVGSSMLFELRPSDKGNDSPVSERFRQGRSFPFRFELPHFDVKAFPDCLRVGIYLQKISWESAWSSLQTRRFIIDLESWTLNGLVSSLLAHVSTITANASAMLVIKSDWDSRTRADRDKALHHFCLLSTFGELQQKLNRSLALFGPPTSMAKLDELPTELLGLIIQNLAKHHETLVSLCLVGKHSILGAALPLTWRQLTWKGTRQSAMQNLANRVKDFCSNPRRAAVVRCIIFYISDNEHGSNELTKQLNKELPKLVNVSHLYWVGKGKAVWIRMLRCFIQKLPLLSLNLISWPFNHTIADPFHELRLATIRHLSVIDCGEAMSVFWRPTIEIVEIDDMQGISDLAAAIHPGLIREDLSKLVRLVLHCRCIEIECRDLESIVIFFDEAVQRNVSFPCLQEFVLEVPCVNEEYRDIFDGLTAPQLRKLWIEFADMLDADQPVSFAKFPLLEEVFLPVRTLEDFEFVDFSKNFKLSHVYLTSVIEIDARGLSTPDFQRRTLVEYCLEHLPAFLSISYNTTTLHRRDLGTTRFATKPYRKPGWATLRGIGDWKRNKLLCTGVFLHSTMPSLIKCAFLRKHSETRAIVGTVTWLIGTPMAEITFSGHIAPLSVSCHTNTLCFAVSGNQQLQFKHCQFDLLGMLNTKALDAKGQKRRRTNQWGLIRHQQLPLRLTEAITKTHPDRCSSCAEADPTCRWCCLRMSSSIALLNSGTNHLSSLVLLHALVAVSSGMLSEFKYNARLEISNKE
ncbi:hypothetical protein C8J56DRAFT_888243 [Mycena floridula]|nr:hypothetical protein C8J56DRAFT_888243 [Mycena floridula]